MKSMLSQNGYLKKKLCKLPNVGAQLEGSTSYLFRHVCVLVALSEVSLGHQQRCGERLP